MEKIFIKNAEFKAVKELVLYNWAGCEIDRREFNTDDEYDKIIRDWSRNLTAGDRIEEEERESEI